MKYSIKDGAIFIDVDDTLIIEGNSNLKLIDKMKDWKLSGRDIIVWTSNFSGVEHAHKIVNSLGIQDIVDLILPKPTTIVDDDHLEYYNIIDPITLEYK